MKKALLPVLLALLLFPARMGVSPGGYVMVEFAGDTPALVTDTPVSSLPAGDVKGLLQGICLPDRNSYTKAMEDFCS